MHYKPGAFARRGVDRLPMGDVVVGFGASEQ